MIKKVLLIGGGKFSLGSEVNGKLVAGGHLEALRTLKCDISIQVYDPFNGAKLISKVPDVVMIKDLEKALSSQSYDVVSIVSPNHTHLSLLKKIIKTGKNINNILIEKPLCINMDELTEIKELTENNKDISFFINHSWAASIMFSPALKKIFEGISAKTITCEYYGGFLNIGAHIFSIIAPLLINSSCSLLFADRTNFQRTPEDANYDFVMQADFGRIHFISFDENDFQVLNLRIFHKEGVIEILEYGTRIKVWEKNKLSAETELKMKIDHYMEPKSTLSKIYQNLFSLGAQKYSMEGIKLNKIIENYVQLLNWKEQLDDY
jgi:hypothetical protein